MVLVLPQKVLWSWNRCLKRITKIIRELEDLSSEERLKNFGLLLGKKLRNNMIELYMLWEKQLEGSVSPFCHNTRSKDHPEPGRRFKIDKKKHFFSALNAWNSLLQCTVTATGLDGFKRGLDHDGNALPPGLTAICYQL